MYQAYGAAWALSVYLEAIEKEYTAVSKIEYTSTQTIRDSTGLLHRSKALFERCQPAHWASVLLTAAGMLDLKQEVARIKGWLREAREPLWELRDALK